MGPLSGKICLIGLMLLGLASAADAEQFTVRGPMSSFTDGLTGDTYPAAQFEAVVTYDPSEPVKSSNSFFGQMGTWSNSVTSVIYRIYSSAGEQLVSQTLNFDATMPSGAGYGITSAQENGFGQSANWRIRDDANGTARSAIITFSDPDKGLFITVSQYPDPASLKGKSGSFAINYQSDTNQFSAYGAISDVQVGAADSDGDGIVDDQDSCPNSNLSPTLVVNGQDSGVENTLQPDGCTLADNLGEEGSADQIAHGTNALRKDGTISGRDKGKIQSAAARGKH